MVLSLTSKPSSNIISFKDPLKETFTWNVLWNIWHTILWMTKFMTDQERTDKVEQLHIIFPAVIIL